MDTIKISAVVLSYNGGDKMIPTLESCKLQTYPHKDLIVADDASTDNGYTVSIIMRWLKDNSQYFENVQFLNNPQNLGVVANFRNAALRAHGDIIFGQSQGDICYSSETFSLLASEIRRQRNEVCCDDPLIWLAYYRSFSLIDDWHIVNHLASMPFQLKLIQERSRPALKKLLYGNFIGGASFIYSKKYFAENNYPIPKEIRNIEDYPCLLYMLLNNYNIGFIPFFVRWYEHGVGMSSRGNNLNSFVRDSQIRTLEWIETLSGLTESEKLAIRILKEYTRSDNRLSFVFRHPIFSLNKTISHLYKIFYSKLFLSTNINKISYLSGSSFPEDMMKLSEYL